MNNHKDVQKPLLREELRELHDKDGKLMGYKKTGNPKYFGPVQDSMDKSKQE